MKFLPIRHDNYVERGKAGGQSMFKLNLVHKKIVSVHATEGTEDPSPKATQPTPTLIAYSIIQTGEVFRQEFNSVSYEKTWQKYEAVVNCYNGGTNRAALGRKRTGGRAPYYRRQAVPGGAQGIALQKGQAEMSDVEYREELRRLLITSDGLIKLTDNAQKIDKETMAHFGKENLEELAGTNGILMVCTYDNTASLKDYHFFQRIEKTWMQYRTGPKETLVFVPGEDEERSWQHKIPIWDVSEVPIPEIETEGIIPEGHLFSTPGSRNNIFVGYFLVPPNAPIKDREDTPIPRIKPPSKRGRKKQV